MRYRGAVLLLSLAAVPAVCTSYAQTADTKSETRAFVVTAAIDWAATMADAAISSRAHFQPGPAHCHETNRIYGGLYPTAPRLWGQMAAQTAGITLAAYLLKRRHKNWFVVLPLVDSMFHAVGAIDTAHYCR